MKSVSAILNLQISLCQNVTKHYYINHRLIAISVSTVTSTLQHTLRISFFQYFSFNPDNILIIRLISWLLFNLRFFRVTRNELILFYSLNIKVRRPAFLETLEHQQLRLLELFKPLQNLISQINENCHLTDLILMFVKKIPSPVVI